MKLRRQLTELIRGLMLSGGDLPGIDGNCSLDRLVAGAEFEAPTPLLDLIMAPPGHWSLDRATRLLGSVDNDHFARLAVLEAACRILGEKWCSDEYDFVGVSIGTARLQSLMRRISIRSQGQATRRSKGSALFVTTPGEQHLFGPCLIEETFRAQGWHTGTLFPGKGQSLGLYDAFNRFQVICFSWSTGALKDEALQAVADIRRHVRPGHTLVLAGGAAVLDNRQTLERAGIDHICARSNMGLAFAERFASESHALSAS